MPFTADDLEAVRRAIATGERTVVYADRSVTYRSIDELLAAEKRILQALGGKPRQQLGVTSKGF